MMAPRTHSVPGGSFYLGAVPQDKYANSTEGPRRFVEVASFSLGIFPVTRREWFNDDIPGEPDHPITGVSWKDVMVYLDRLNKATDGQWRLPSEIEWEYVCRAGSETLFCNSDSLAADQANFLFDESIHRIGPGRITPVGSYAPNAWGFHDLHGNVNEWTASPWTRSHESGAVAEAGRHTVRGGSWDALPRLLRCSWRDGLTDETRRDNLGFRLARG